jgi:hypothetical protein
MEDKFFIGDEFLAGYRQIDPIATRRSENIAVQSRKAGLLEDLHVVHRLTKGFLKCFEDVIWNPEFASSLVLGRGATVCNNALLSL